MSVRAVLEAAGWRQMDDDGRWVAPGWAPHAGEPTLPAGLAFVPEGLTMQQVRAACSGRAGAEAVMVGWHVTRKSHPTVPWRCTEHRRPLTRWVLGECDRDGLVVWVARRREQQARAERKRIERAMRERHGRPIGDVLLSPNSPSGWRSDERRG